MKTFSRKLLHTAFAAGLLALSGCASAPPPAPKLPHVKMESLTHDVLFLDGSALVPTERQNLNAFVAGLPRDAVNSVELATADTEAQSIRRANYVRNYFQKAGYNKQLFRLVPQEKAAADVVSVRVLYAKGIPPQDCPDWSRGSQGNFGNRDASNFGCAYYTNFIVQLANPADYEGGRGTQAISAARDGISLQRYHSNSPPPTSSTNMGSLGSNASTTTGASSGGNSSSSGAP